jgi:TPR repeat protein
MGHYDQNKVDSLLNLADAGDRDAQYRMGLIFATETGDDGMIHAHKWFNIAATSGDARARAERQELSELMDPAQIAQAQKLARSWMLDRAV